MLQRKIFMPSDRLRYFNEISRKDVTYDNVKATSFTPSLENSFFIDPPVF